MRRIRAAGISGFVESKEILKEVSYECIVPLFQSGSEFAACVAGLVQPQPVPLGSRGLSSEKPNMVSRGNVRLGIDGQGGSFGRRQEGSRRNPMKTRDIM